MLNCERALADCRETEDGVARERETSAPATLLSGSYGYLIVAFYDLLAELAVGRWDPDRPEVAVLLANLGRRSHAIGDFQAAFRRGGRRAKWDIAQHLIARNDFRLPEDYADVFRVLSEAGAPHYLLPCDTGQLLSGRRSALKTCVNPWFEPQ